MISSEVSSAGGAARSAHTRWSPQCNVLMAALFFLIASFFLVDARAGITELAFINNHITSVEGDSAVFENDNVASIEMHEPFTEPSPQPCSGDKPGVCP
jgi:hypothetical protein